MGYYARECPNLTVTSRRNNNERSANLMDFAEEYFDDEEEYEEYEGEEGEDYYGSETFFNTRSSPYPSNPVFINRRTRKPESESTTEELLRTIDPVEQMDSTPIQPLNVETSTVKKPRRRMIPAPI